MRKQKIILDTDIGCDCDDAGALALLHALEMNNEVQILAITHVTSSPYGAPLIDLINCYFKRPEIPIGILTDTDFMSEDRYDTYASKTIKKFDSDCLKNERVYESAVRVMRKALVGQETESTKLVAIGQMRNIRYLLESEPDDISPYTGTELISQKVSEMVIMGGYFPKPGQTVWLDGKIMKAEFNIVNDIDSARIVADQFPKPIVYTGYEIGCEIRTGSVLYHTCSERNPIRYIYEIHNNNHIRESWDQTAVLYAARGLRDYWDASPFGFVRVDDQGVTKWYQHPDKKHRYLLERESPLEIQTIIDELMSREPSEN